MAPSFSGLPRIDLRAGGDGAAQRAWSARCRRAAGIEGDADTAAREVIEQVRREGDAAIARLTHRFEGRELAPAAFELSAEAIAVGAARIPADLRAALETAAHNVRTFHETQVTSDTGLQGGGTLLQSRVIPLHRVAVYVPGGTAPYPSSVLMTAVPAKVAGVDEVCMFTPRPADVVLAAAQIAGVDRVFQIGGAQAVAAAALGTEHIPRADKIVGPGNAYVTAAKRQVFGLCDIDGIAGPSEIMVVADETANPDLVAADLISQAEHDPLACAILLTDRPDLPDRVDAALREQLEDLPRREIATRSLMDHGAAVLVDDPDQMVLEANTYAPEHLELLVLDPHAMADRIRAAGAIFVGSWTPEAAGDYTAGPSHVLPTAGAARFHSPLGVWDFVRHMSVVSLQPQVLRAQAGVITTLARAEGFEGHARAVERRLGDPSGEG